MAWIPYWNVVFGSVKDQSCQQDVGVCFELKVIIVKRITLFFRDAFTRRLENCQKVRVRREKTRPYRY